MVENACQLLMDKRKMLQDYFSLIFDSEGRLISIPMLLGTCDKIFSENM